MTSHRSICLNPFCGTHVPQCPKCGRQAFDAGEIARRGRHVLLLGLLLAAIMGGVFWMLGRGIIAALGGNANGGLCGSAGQAKLAFIGFRSLLAAGTAWRSAAC